LILKPLKKSANDGFIIIFTLLIAQAKGL